MAKKIAVLLAVQASIVMATPKAHAESVLACVRRGESHSDYHAVSRSGRYRNAYQFDESTWRAVVARHGRPEWDWRTASPREQDQAAAWLYAERGLAPWPVTGRRCGARRRPPRPRRREYMMPVRGPW